MPIPGEFWFSLLFGAGEIVAWFIWLPRQQWFQERKLKVFLSMVLLFVVVFLLGVGAWFGDQDAARQLSGMVL